MKFDKAVEKTLMDLEELQRESGLDMIERIMFTLHAKQCFILLKKNYEEGE